MLEDTTIHNAITDKALASYFRSSGNLLEEESAVLGQAVTNLMLSGDNVNNKNIKFFQVINRKEIRFTQDFL